MLRDPDLRVRELSEENRLMLLRLSEQVSQMAARLDKLVPPATDEGEARGAFRLESPRPGTRPAEPATSSARDVSAEIGSVVPDFELPDVGLATFEDLESGESIVVDTGDPRVRAHYAHAMGQLRDARRQLFNKLCYQLLGGTPRLSGSNALVFEGANIVTTGAPSITTIDALDSAIVKGERLKADNGGTADYLGLPMRVVVGPRAVRTKFDQLLGANASTYVPGAGGRTGNDGVRPKWLDSITPVVDAELDRAQGNGVSFYGFADPAIHPAFVRTQLAGEAVSMQMVQDPETRGSKLIVFATFNVQATSKLGVAKVAAS